jgi:hypothetical protein
MTQPLPSVSSEKGHMLYSLASNASVQQHVPSAHTLSDTVSLNGVIYSRQVNCASVCLSSFPVGGPVPHSLMDGGANGGLSGSDVRVISESVLTVNISGIGNTNLTNLPLCTVAGLIKTTAGPIVGIFNQYAHLGTGHTIHSCNQMRSYGAIVDDVPCALGGDQHIISPNGCYVIPLSVAGGLTYLKMQPPSDHDLETFEWVPFTSSAAWDLSYLSDSASTDIDFSLMPPSANSCVNFSLDGGECLLAKPCDLAEKDLGHVPMIDSSLLKLTACSFKKCFGISEHEAWGDVDWMHPLYSCYPAVPLLVATDAVMRQITNFSSVWICIASIMLNSIWLDDLANVADILKLLFGNIFYSDYFVSRTSQWGVSTGKLFLSTASRDCAHALSHGTQGKPAKTNLVCLVTDCKTDCFGLVTGQLNVQKHHVTVLGLDRYHAQKHGYYDKLDHGSVYNTVGLMKMVHGDA